MLERKRICVLSLLVSSFLMHAYLNSLRIFDYAGSTAIFWVSLVLMGISLVACLFIRSENLFVLGLYIVAISLMYVSLSRFPIMYGTDIWEEYRVAQMVNEVGRWSAYSGYSSSLSITILPTMISKVSGMDVMTVFRFLFPALAALIPVLSYLVFRKQFGYKVAGLAGILVTFDYVLLAVYPNVMRQNLAFVLLLTSIYLMSRPDRNSRFLLLLTVATTVVFHYGTAFVLLAAMLMIALAQMRGPRKNLRFQTWLLVPYVFVLAVAWPLFTSTLFFDNQIVILNRIAEGIIGISPQYRMFHALTQYAFQSPFGLLNTIMNDSFRILIALGIVVGLKKDTAEKRMYAFISAFFFAMLVIWIFLPSLSVFLYADRVYSFALPFFSLSLAVAISFLLDLPARIRCVGTVKGFPFEKLFAVGFVIAFAVNGVSQLQPFFYQPFSTLRPESYIIYPVKYPYDVSAGLWLTVYGNDSFLSTSDLKEQANLLYLWNTRRIHVVTSDLYSILNNTPDEIYSALGRFKEKYNAVSSYILVADYMLSNGTLIVKDSTGKRAPLNLPLENVNLLMEAQRVNLVYNSQNIYLLVN